MLTFSAFASLAQLGAGLALVMTAFLEPITAKERRLRRKLEGSLQLIPSLDEKCFTERRNEIFIKITDLNRQSQIANERAAKPLFLIKIGALINFLTLIFATMTPNYELNNGFSFFIFLSLTIPIITGFLVLVKISRDHFDKIDG